LKKLVYLISPNRINKNFYSKLDAVLSHGNVKFFQLRLKKIKLKNFLNIAIKIKKITSKHKVKFLINDNYMIAKKSKADGCHMGQLDGSVEIAKKNLRNKIIGVTCHNSKVLAKKAVKDKANYLAFGSFFKSKLKPNAKKSSLNILWWAKKNIKKPIVVIGGINNLNYKKLIKSGANYIAISSFIWDNPKIKPELAIKKFK
jgi:thiamine-phosphate pyrophosphorylase|tara:strand:+ start:217 stop:819 length:603 start_codon:yes stop_codon:yes gene_type:complete